MARMRSSTKEHIRELNENLKEWDELGLTSNALDRTREMIKGFYKSAGKKVKDESLLSTRIKLTDEQADELDLLIEAMTSDPEMDIDYYIDKEMNINEDAFEKMRDKYPDAIQSKKDYIRAYDQLNRFKNDELLSSIMDSDQIMRLYGYGAKKGWKEEDINFIIGIEYNMSGATYDNLYNSILKAIEET